MKLPPYVRNLVDDVRALRGARLIIAATLAGFVVFVLWATLARVDEVTRGQGRVIPSSKVQVIQPSQPASITAILVRGGQSV